MAHRIFTDSNGTPWLVLAVYPSLAERRSHDRRREERVTDPDQRKTQRRTKVRRSMQKGWLVFKADNARRRFTPIIDDWDTCPVEELEKLLNRAVPARRTGDKFTPPKP